ncbi:MAG TPA: AAA family ATPase, partial [Candidatus Acidoferrum sp.]|nr:AAA family ATPase [Candidatus Acidoferrum sp.]
MAVDTSAANYHYLINFGDGAMSNQPLNFHYDSLRFQKARLGVRMQTGLVQLQLLVLLLVPLVGGALMLLFLNIFAGVVIASFAAWPLMLIVWYRVELRDVPPAPHPATLDDIISSDLLGRLPHNPTPQQLAKIVNDLDGGRFFRLRFGIGRSFADSLSTKPEDSQVIWERAYQLATQFQVSMIDSVLLLVALLENVPGIDQNLAHLHLASEDLPKGAGWYEHIRTLIAQHKKHESTGGIGRDWSFGYVPLLEKFAINVSDSIEHGGITKRDIETHQDMVGQMINILSGGGRQNVALIGPTGSGKTTLVYSLAEAILLPDKHKIPKSLSYCQVMSLDPASLISQVHAKGDLENLVEQLFYEAIKAKNIILFLDNAELFLEDGTGSIDLSNLLLPILDGNNLRVIV